jgi:hypothetical protein
MSLLSLSTGAAACYCGVCVFDMSSKEERKPGFLSVRVGRRRSSFVFV